MASLMIYPSVGQTPHSGFRRYARRAALHAQAMPVAGSLHGFLPWAMPAAQILALLCPTTVDNDGIEASIEAAVTTRPVRHEQMSANAIALYKLDKDEFSSYEKALNDFKTYVRATVDPTLLALVDGAHLGAFLSGAQILEALTTRFDAATAESLRESRDTMRTLKIENGSALALLRYNATFQESKLYLTDYAQSFAAYEEYEFLHTAAQAVLVPTDGSKLYGGCTMYYRGSVQESALRTYETFFDAMLLVAQQAGLADVQPTPNPYAHAAVASDVPTTSALAHAAAAPAQPPTIWCHSHGPSINPTHTSARCRTSAPGHDSSINAPTPACPDGLWALLGRAPARTGRDGRRGNGGRGGGRGGRGN